MLLEKGGVDVNNRYYFGYTPLSSAAKGGHTEIVKMLLEKGGVDVNNTNDFGYTPLSLATKEGHTEIVKIVTEHGATVDRKGKRVMTPLSHAAQSHRVEALNIPLRSSADSNLKDEIPGRTPLIWSFYNPHPLYEDKDYHDCDILNSLLSYPDTNVNAKANDGSTALSRAINVNSMKPKNS
ncbi:ankyrin repeat-containing domain protein [Pyronema omphalodes]|nr:ankyrin repeat-containing domain protein [Pyronema omphalodes]